MWSVRYWNYTVIDADLSEVIEFDEFVQIFKAAKNNKKLKTRKNKFGVFSSKYTCNLEIACGDDSNKMQSSVSIETSISEYSRKLIINMLHRKNQ